VRFVDDEHPDAVDQCGQLVVAKAGVVEAFGGDEQHIDFIVGELLLNFGPFVGVGGVDGDGSNSGAGCRRNLVAHEGEQWRHEHGRARTSSTHEQGGNEVDGGLSPPGALHDKRATAPIDECLDRLKLSLMKIGSLIAHKRAENGQGVGAGICHLASVAGGAGRQRTAAGFGSRVAAQNRTTPFNLAGAILGHTKAKGRRNRRKLIALGLDSGALYVELRDGDCVLNAVPTMHPTRSLLFQILDRQFRKYVVRERKGEFHCKKLCIRARQLAATQAQQRRRVRMQS